MLDNEGRFYTGKLESALCLSSRSIVEMNMKTHKVCVVGGHCSNRYMIVAEQLSTLFTDKGIPCQVFTQGVTGEYSFPPRASLILQLLPAFTAAEAGCPVINIKPLIGDPNHSETIQKILDQLKVLMTEDHISSSPFAERGLASSGGSH
jgi:hypothetical protein